MKGGRRGRERGRENVDHYTVVWVRGLMAAGRLPEGKKQFTVVLLRFNESITVL